MIIKIVKLIIEKEKVDEFQLFFKKSKLSISNFNVNNYVVLIKETEERNISLARVIGKMKRCLKILEIQIFFRVYGKIQKHIFLENLKLGV